MQLLATIIPSIILVYIFYTFDKFPEPRKYIIITFILGIIIAFPAGYLNVFVDSYLKENIDYNSPYYFLQTLIPGPVVEELATEYDGKAVIGKVNVDQNPEISQVRFPKIREGQLEGWSANLIPPDRFVYNLTLKNKPQHFLWSWGLFSIIRIKQTPDFYRIGIRMYATTNITNTGPRDF